MDSDDENVEEAVEGRKHVCYELLSNDETWDVGCVRYSSVVLRLWCQLLVNLPEPACLSVGRSVIRQRLGLYFRNKAALQASEGGLNERDCWSRSLKNDDDRFSQPATVIHEWVLHLVYVVTDASI